MVARQGDAAQLERSLPTCRARRPVAACACFAVGVGVGVGLGGVGGGVAGAWLEQRGQEGVFGSGMQVFTSVKKECCVLAPWSRGRRRLASAWADCAPFRTCSSGSVAVIPPNAEKISRDTFFASELQDDAHGGRGVALEKGVVALETGVCCNVVTCGSKEGVVALELGVVALETGGVAVNTHGMWPRAFSASLA